MGCANCDVWAFFDLIIDQQIKKKGFTTTAILIFIQKSTGSRENVMMMLCEVLQKRAIGLIPQN